jgi:hypothetical protein
MYYSNLVYNVNLRIDLGCDNFLMFNYFAGNKSKKFFLTMLADALYNPLLSIMNY